MKRRQFLKLSGQMAVVAAFSPSFLIKPGSPPVEFDLIIQNGTIINGQGEPAFQADIGISGGKIRFIGRLAKDISRQPAKIVEAADRIVCPGFIDIHSHSGLELLVNPKAESKIRQGVTTELSGNCGGSDFPRKAELSEEAQSSWQELGLKPTWVDLAGFRERLLAQGISLNYATLVGHGTLRSLVMGDERRPPTASELGKMKELVAAAMEQGAFGLSTGLEYTPSGFAEREEIIELCRVVAEFGGFYATHVRSEDNQVIEAVGEAISIAEEAQLPLELSHLKACGQRNWWKMPFLFDLIEKARARGVEVTADAYPYTAYSTGLTVFFPHWALAGGAKEFLRKVAAAEERQKMRPEVEEKLAGMPWERVVIVDLKTEKNKPLIGQNIAAAAKSRKQDPFNFSCDLLLEEDGEVSIVGFGMSDTNTEAVLRHSLVMIASDGSALAPYGPLHRGLPHPRNYGTFPRFLGVYVREKKILSLPEAIKKITSLPAAKMGLKDRGAIQPDYWADIVIFDPDKILDLATYTEPEKYPVGIDYVLVNGQVVVDHGEHTGARPGQILSNPKKRVGVGS